MSRWRQRPRGAGQRGSAAIEFALVFPLFFAVFYAIVQYGFAFFLQQALTQAVEEGARAAVQDAPDNGTRQGRAQAMVAASLSWLPDAAALAPQVSFIACPGNATATCVTVSLGHATLVPSIDLPGLNVMPAQLTATATVQL